MGQQVVGQQHRLRPLQVGVARQVDVSGVGGAMRQRVLQSHDLVRDRHERPTAPEPQGGRDLVVAAATRVQLRAGVACQLGHPPLNCGVHILVVGREGEHPGLELLLHDVEGVDERANLAVGQDAGLAQALHVGP